MPSAERVALVTGGGRGVGANVARALAEDGFSVVVAARTREQVEAVAEEIGGRWLELDVTSAGSIERAVAEAGEIELLVNNAGITGPDGHTWEADPDRWWLTHEVNVRGPYLCCRAAIPGMLARGAGRIVNVASGAAYLPSSSMDTAYASSKAALHRFSELLAGELTPHGISVFSISPGLVRTAMTEDVFPDDAPWTPPEAAPTLVRKLATGSYDVLAGRYLHAEHDDLDELMSRLGQVRDNDLNAIRLRR
jgi:NAD(P)-dependent dehydrogenase (short-subunit alcohol dehydrogenase family)